MASADGSVAGFEAGGDHVASYQNDPGRPGARWHTNHPLATGGGHPLTQLTRPATTGRRARLFRV